MPEMIGDWGDPRGSSRYYTRLLLLLAQAAVMLAGVSAPALAADCSTAADEVNARCYPTLQAAADAALASDRPLLLPRGTYQGPLVIDYTAHAGTGFELISHGATIDGGLTVECQRDCFYFHQEGTLFISGQSSATLFALGKADFSDPQNSVKIDHLIVNNGGSGIACQFNYVLASDINAVCDSAGQIGMDVRQLQFSTLHGAATAEHGYAMAIRDGYVIANVFQAIDQEASPVCTLFTSPNANGNTWIGYYQNCPLVNVLASDALSGNTVSGGVWGGDVQQAAQWIH
jgi:hypothetical protein